MEYNKETDTIIFKSNPEFYEKEQSGLKCNTVRVFEDDELKILDEMDDYPKNIMIKNKVTRECFKRKVTDVTIVGMWEPIYIFSWKDILCTL